MRRWLPKILVAAICAILGVVAAILYSERGASHPIGWLDKSVDASADFVVKYLLGRDNFSSQLRASINAYLPELDHLPKSRYRLLLVRTLTPLPDPDQSPDLFDYVVMSDWCDHVPQWRSDGVYQWHSDRTVSSNYENLLNWVSAPAGDVELGTKFELAAGDVQRLTALQYGMQANTKPQKKAASVANRAQLTKDLEAARARLAAIAAALKTRNESIVAAKLQLLDFSYRPMLPDGVGNVRRIRSCSTFPEVKSVMRLGDQGGDVRVASGSTSVSINRTGFGQPAFVGEVSADVTISGSRLVVVQLDRSPWFNQGLVKMYANGPWREGSRPSFWGIDGDFGLVPDRLVILVEPKVTLKLPSRRVAEMLRSYGGDNLSLTFGSQLILPGQFRATRAEKAENDLEIELASPKATVLAVLARTMP